MRRMVRAVGTVALTVIGLSAFALRETLAVAGPALAVLPAPVDTPTTDAPAEPGRAMLRNVSWRKVLVEVRVGTSANCEENALVGQYTLWRGRAWKIESAEPICWRRIADPTTTTGEWTPWERLTVDPTRTVNRNL